MEYFLPSDTTQATATTAASMLVHYAIPEHSTQRGFCNAKRKNRKQENKTRGFPPYLGFKFLVSFEAAAPEATPEGSQQFTNCWKYY